MRIIFFRSIYRYIYNLLWYLHNLFSIPSLVFIPPRVLTEWMEISVKQYLHWIDYIVMKSSFHSHVTGQFLCWCQERFLFLFTVFNCCRHLKILEALLKTIWLWQGEDLVALFTNVSLSLNATSCSLLQVHPPSVELPLLVFLRHGRRNVFLPSTRIFWAVCFTTSNRLSSTAVFWLPVPNLLLATHNYDD